LPKSKLVESFVQLKVVAQFDLLLFILLNSELNNFTSGWFNVVFLKNKIWVLYFHKEGTNGFIFGKNWAQLNKSSQGKINKSKVAIFRK
jgi:hypothetical protein